MQRMIAVLFGALATASSLHGQTKQPDAGTTYAFKVAVPVWECGIDGKTVPSGTKAIAPAGAKFRYIESPADTSPVVIQFLVWKDTAQREFRLFNTSDKTGTGVKTFCVTKAHFDKLSERVYAKWWESRQLAAGTLLLPVKMRGRDHRPFDFSKDVTLGTAAGFKLRINETREEYANILVGVGLTSVALDSVNTLGAVHESTDRAALTWTTGLMIEIDRFQFGAFVGQDRLSQPNQKDWVYQGKLWLALGLGYSLFGSGGTEKPAGAQ